MTDEDGHVGDYRGDSVPSIQTYRSTDTRTDFYQTMLSVIIIQYGIELNSLHILLTRKGHIIYATHLYRHFMYYRYKVVIIVDRLHQHLCHPRSHCRQFPTHPGDKFQPSPQALCLYLHQLDEQSRGDILHNQIKCIVYSWSSAGVMNWSIRVPTISSPDLRWSTHDNMYISEVTVEYNNFCFILLQNCSGTALSYQYSDWCHMIDVIYDYNPEVLYLLSVFICFSQFHPKYIVQPWTLLPFPRPVFQVRTAFLAWKHVIKQSTLGSQICCQVRYRMEDLRRQVAQLLHQQTPPLAESATSFGGSLSSYAVLASYT